MYPVSAADDTAVNPNGIKIILVSDLITFFFLMVQIFLIMDQEVCQEIFLIVSS